MKRLATAVLAAVTLAGSLASAAPAYAHERRHERGWDRRDRDHDDDDDRRGRRHGSRADRQHDEWRRERAYERWDDRRHNGYWHDSRWYYGPPPGHWRDDVRYDYRAWRRGERLPAYYRDSYRPIDYRRHHLRAPPRGYHYVYNDDREEYLLIGIATGVILGVILAGE